MCQPKLCIRKKISHALSNLFIILVLLSVMGCAEKKTEQTGAHITEQSTKQITPSHRPGESIRDIEARQQLVEEAVELQGLTNQDVIEALETVPRHEFVPAEYQDLAYSNTAIPIGYGQTISQPSLVAYMTELLELEPGDKVLEIGTGSGYQAALLAELGYVEVYSIEIVPELYERSTDTLYRLGYSEVRTKNADGYYGWSEYAPFNAIIVTAAPDHLPAPLTRQLAEGGIMVIPIGPQGFYQTLWKFVKEKGELTGYSKGPVIFVPFTGEAEKESVPIP